MNTTSSSRALVLGGGGSAGNAWLIGVLAGLADAGRDAADVDLIVGTSAGATTAAQVTGGDARSLLADIRNAPPLPDRRPAGATPGINALEATGAIIAESADVADMRRRMGAWAMTMDVDGLSERWRATVAARFAQTSWPATRLALTAVDAETGEPVVFDAESGVDLVDAVAASTAGGFAYRIGDRRYIDGGYRTNADNADLAAGHGSVLVLSPLGGRTRLPLSWGLDLATQVDALRAEGAEVEVVLPDAASLRAFGDNMMSLATRVPAAEAGHEQGRALGG